MQDQAGAAVVDVQGGVRWTAAIGGSDSLMGATPDRLLVYDLSNNVYEVTASGRRQVGSLGGRPQHAVASPDGSRWAWSTLDSSNDTPAVTTLHVGGVGLAPKVILSNSETRLFLEPWSWTAAGIWVEHNVSGLGGRYAFAFPTGPVDLVDPETGRTTRLAVPDGCYVEARAQDGTLACLNRPAAAFSQFNSVTIVRSGSQPLTVQLPKPDYNSVGNLVFSADAAQLLVGADNFDGTLDHYRTGAVDTRTGALTTLVDGYSPALGHGQSLLPDGSLLLARTLQEPGIWIQSPSGSITRLYASGYPAALVSG